MVIKARFSRAAVIVRLAVAGDGHKLGLFKPFAAKLFDDFIPSHSGKADVQKERLRMK